MVHQQAVYKNNGLSRTMFLVLDRALRQLDGFERHHGAVLGWGGGRRSWCVHRSVLAEVLGVPLRDRNWLMHAAGFAPLFQQHALENDEMRAVREVLARTLTHHEPYPAMVVNRQWDLLMSNGPAERFVTLLVLRPELIPPQDPELFEVEFEAMSHSHCGGGHA
jgi:hypothetical protein